MDAILSFLNGECNRFEYEQNLDGRFVYLSSIYRDNHIKWCANDPPVVTDQTMIL